MRAKSTRCYANRVRSLRSALRLDNPCRDCAVLRRGPRCAPNGVDPDASAQSDTFFARMVRPARHSRAQQ